MAFGFNSVSGAGVCCCFLFLFTSVTLWAQKVDTAFVLNEKELITEGITYSKSLKTFFVGSIYKRKIVAVDKRGNVRDLISPGQHGTKSFLGMKVDRSGSLWAICTGYRIKEGEPWRTALFKLHPKTGALLGKYTHPDTLAGFNDFTFGVDGTVYLTDTGSGAIIMKPAGSETFDNFLPAKTFSFPNGIAMMHDTLVICDSNGIWMVPLRSKQPVKIESPSAELGGIDGLSIYKNDFVAVQNGVTPRRVIRIKLNAEKTKAEEVKILDMHDTDRRYYSPTTGVVVGDDFYFLSNSQVRSFDANRKIFPMDKLEPVYIKRIRLK